jgi:DNA-binding HxlR family transcriptional regulator
VAASDLAQDPIALTLDVLRSRSGFLVMREVFYGVHRFDELQRRLDLAPTSLATRLKTLVRDGLLERELYREAGQRARHRYVLSKKGAALLPVLVALARWGNDHLLPKGEGLMFTHQGCGAVVTVGITCGAGHGVGLDDIRAVRGAAPESEV